MPLESTFSYSNAPQAIVPKKKYRGTSDEGHAQDMDTALPMMSDPRVVRGAASRQNKTGVPGRRRGTADTQEDVGSHASHPRKPTPSYNYTVKCLVQPEIDLSQYLEERLPEAPQRRARVAETQTDKFTERPVTPEYVPRKTGVDTHTQVEDVSELFNFDMEVEPILAVLCAKTMEQALFELQGEGELINLQQECDRCG